MESSASEWTPLNFRAPSERERERRTGLVRDSWDDGSDGAENSPRSFVVGCRKKQRLEGGREGVRHRRGDQGAVVNWAEFERPRGGRIEVDGVEQQLRIHDCVQ